MNQLSNWHILLIGCAIVLTILVRRLGQQKSLANVFPPEVPEENLSLLEPPKTKHHGTCIHVAVYRKGNRPIASFSDVRNVTAYPNGTVCVMRGTPPKETTIILASNDLFIGKGPLTECIWDNVFRVRIWRRGLLIFDQKIASVNLTLFDSHGIHGYLESGEDIILVPGRELTAVVENLP